MRCCGADFLNRQIAVEKAKVFLSKKRGSQIAPTLQDRPNYTKSKFCIIEGSENGGFYSFLVKKLIIQTAHKCLLSCLKSKSRKKILAASGAVIAALLITVILIQISI